MSAFGHNQVFAAWLSTLNDFAGWFSEKGVQMQPESLTVFGIPISSRYGKVWEMMEMLGFAQVAASAGVAGYIASIFYDSKACLCTIELKEEARHNPDVQTAVQWCGERTLSLFVVDEVGTVLGAQP